MSNALLTLNIGGMLMQQSRESMQHCCERWACEFREVTELPGDPPHMHAACYKTKAFQLCDADRLFIVDADTIIRSDCPNPFELFPEDALTAVFQTRGWGPNDGIEKSEWEKCMQFACNEQESELVTKGINLSPSLEYFNSGVMCVSREHHSKAFFRAYMISVNQGFSWYDQTPINFCIRADGLKVNGAPQEWNLFNPDWVGGQWKDMTAFIYHFAGNPGRAQKIPQVKWRKS